MGLYDKIVTPGATAEKLKTSLQSLDAVYETHRERQMERWECWRLATEERIQRSVARRRKLSVAISAATCRGAKCPTLKTAEKQTKHPKNSCFDCFSGVSAVFLAVLP